MQAIQVGTLIMLVGSMAFLLVLVGRRSWLAAQARRRTAAVQALRPAAIELVEDVGDPPVLHGFQAEVFAELLSGYAIAVRGAPRERIAAYFERAGAVDEQLRLLRSRRGWKRATAAFALGDMGSLRAVPALLEALDDRNGDVRAAASRSLGRIGPEEAIEPLVTAGVERRVPRDVAMLALLDVGPSAVPRLLELTQHEEPRVRASAVELVGLLGEAGDAEDLPERLRDTAAEVRPRRPERSDGSARPRRGTRSSRRSTTVSRLCAWRRPGPSASSAAGAPSTPWSVWRGRTSSSPPPPRPRRPPRSTPRS